jgi:two-component system sensor histidine kinase/response regulator
MTRSLRTLLLGLTSLAVVLVTLGDLAVNVKMRMDTAESHLQENTQRLLSASRPLLLNALVVGDLASAEQTMRNLNAGRVWRQARLYEPDGRTLIFDASPGKRTDRHVPEWFGRLLALDLSEARVEITAPPTVYGVLAVVPSAEEVGRALWQETRTMVTLAGALLATLIVVLHVILAYGLRSVRKLGEIAARFGAGDLTVRMPETRLAEVAPTVRAFNAMAQNLEGLMAALRAKEAANRELAASVEQAEEAILTLDLERRVTSWNLGARRLFGQPAEEMLGQPIARIFDGEDADADRLATSLIETRLPERLEFTLTRADSSTSVAASASQLQDEAGHHTGYIVVARDVTMRRAAERALRQAKDAAEAANRAKAEFLATMSHEIRTPMNGVLGMNELLLGSDLSAEQRECATLVQTSAQALLQVINDILDFSKIEAGRIELETLAFDLRATVGRALKPLALRAHEKGLELVCAVHPAVPMHVVGDPGRLRQVLVNLVGNAVKFTEQGEVVVRVEPYGTEEDDVVLHIMVRDTGVGVPAAKRELIFDAFTQADSSTTRRFGGTGLGLAITKRLVQLMRGRIWLDGEDGGGSAFHFTARFAVATAATVVVPEPRQLDGLPVLVVDDNATSRRMLSEMLGAWRLTPQVVDSGEAALATLARARGSREMPGLIITDHEMPGIDGIALTLRLKADPAFARIPVVMLSSSNLPQDVNRARRAGVEVFLSKPVGESELLDAIMSVFAPATGTPAAVATTSTPAPPSATRRGLRVLVAEDNVVNQRVASGLLERRGHRAVVVGTGRAALEALESQPFDVVLMDIEMPELDGFEATAAVRAYEKEIRSGARPVPPGSAYAVARDSDRRVPIVALTAHAMKGMLERCLAAKMDGYVSKPVRAETLDAALAPFLPAAAGATAEEGPAPIDRVAALRAVGGDQALLTDLARLFLEDCPERVADLRAAVASGDPAHVQRAAHAVKGSVGTFGARVARDLAAELERAGREGRLADMPALLGALEAELGRVSGALREEGLSAARPILEVATD